MLTLLVTAPVVIGLLAALIIAADHTMRQNLEAERKHELALARIRAKAPVVTEVIIL